ncbi:epoxyqueuosine reductase QueH [Campylobacter troglodytis]|uniref:epoxyqueuosine reductase QueH n=1 Tax=Campylobacter troglodytis TaxID=654363 RepID=UPI001157E4EA|nr:epoxyqueuosine reductase QueH [Campylobacter troglodytis]TQR59626.1 diacylglucosamine hydrolase like protein [Campylobacter troglodytis]
MLVHICCSVDSHFFISELKKLYPKERLVGFFYDPNIHPYAEYELRYLDVKRSCDKLGLSLHKGEYDFTLWMQAVRGLEDEPERGARCENCFEMRLEEAAKFALKIGEKSLTTTLLTSPKKDFSQLENALRAQCSPFGVEFIAPDFRKNGGTQRQFELAKKEMLYHQNYCGCLYALAKQRQGRGFVDELMSPLSHQILPNSIEERTKLFKELGKLEKRGLKFKLEREKFLNYRLLSAKITADKKPIKAHIMFYSHFKLQKSAFTVNLKDGQGGVLKILKDELVFWDFEYFNGLVRRKFKDFNELLKKPLSVEKEIKLRTKHFGAYNLSPIIICERLPQGKIEIFAKSEIYFDTRERLVKEANA